MAQSVEREPLMAPWHNNPWLRYPAYLLSVALLFQVLVWIASTGDDALRLFVKPNPTDVFGTSEFSLVETAQSLVLAACILVMGWHCRRGKEMRSLGIVLALGLLLMLIREQDYFLDRWLSWEWCVCWLPRQSRATSRKEMSTDPWFPWRRSP